MPRNPTYPKGHILLNRFKVAGTLFGGMGEIIVCADMQEGKNTLVVLKTYFDEYLSDSEAKQRFIKEAEAWLKLGYARDANYLGVREVVNINHKPFILMDFCHGGNLRDKLIEVALEIDTTIIIATQLITALWDIDDRNKMVHRDLKPENILFDKNTYIKITDLGIVKFLEESELPMKARASSSSLTQVGTFIGTVVYAAPEQIYGIDNIDSRVDIWAFGAIVYEMVTGSPPFIAQEIDQLFEAIVSKDPFGLNQFRKKADQKLYDIVMKCLQKERGKRYKNFMELAADWDQIVKFSNSHKLSQS